MNKMKKTTLCLGFAAMTAIAFSSCQSFKDGEGGMQYKIIHDEGKEKIKEGDFISLGVILQREDDSVLVSSYEMDQPNYIAAQKPMYTGDIFTALGMLGEGDSAVFRLNLDTLTSKTGQPRSPEMKGDYIAYTFKINKVIPKGDTADSLFNAEIEKYIAQDREKAKNSESAKVENYIKENKLDVQTTGSGLKYTIEKEGEGAKANVGDTVVVHYTGRFLGGKVFDTSVKEDAQKAGVYNQMREPYEPMKIPIGIGAVVPGWDEGLALLPKGSKATLVLPSSLAYGENGNMGIPPYTPLAFDVEIIDIKPQQGGGTAPQATNPGGAAPAAASK